MTGKDQRMTDNILKIAVTGGAGSGKTAVCLRFRELGVSLISADELARDAVEPDSPAFKQICDRFGREILSADNRIDRRKLRNLIISDPGARKDLERIVHPDILNQMFAGIKELAKQGDAMVVVEVPLLFELDLGGWFDVIILVKADNSIKIQRLMDRDTMSQSNAEAMLATQLDDRVKIDGSDYVIQNNGPFGNMIYEVERLHGVLVQKLSKNA
jgi:dephospho-CoA kinase